MEGALPAGPFDFIDTLSWLLTDLIEPGAFPSLLSARRWLHASGPHLPPPSDATTSPPAAHGESGQVALALGGT